MENKKAYEYLFARVNDSENAEILELTEQPFRIGLMTDNYSYGNDYGVGARVGGRVSVEGSKYKLPMLSRDHCGIGLENGVRYLYDLGSRTGTFLNGKKVKSGGEKLTDGDKIGLIPVDGKFLLELEYHC